MHFSGGLKIQEIGEQDWAVSSCLSDQKACLFCGFTREMAWRFLKQNDLKPVAFESIRWTNGAFSSNWSPIVHGQKNHMRSPSDFWGCASSNLQSIRTDAELKNIDRPTRDDLARLFDDKSRTENITELIAASLRNIDHSVQKITEFYNELLTDTISKSSNTEVEYSTSPFYNFSAYVHAFFLHFGCARDYLAVLIAENFNIRPRGENEISLGRLILQLRQEHLGKYELFDLLISEGLLQKHSTKEFFEQSGWLKEASVMRNEFAHKRAYGSKFIENTGKIKLLDAEFGVYRYYMPIVLSDGSERDLLDLILFFYENINYLFNKLVGLSEFNLDIFTLTDEDIISMDISKP